LEFTFIDGVLTDYSQDWKRKIDQPHHYLDRVGLFRLVGIGFWLLVFAVRFVFLKKKETGSLRSPNPSLYSVLFSPAISVFVPGGGGIAVSWCVVVCSGRIRFGFLWQTVLLFLFFLLFPPSSQPYPTQYHLYFRPLFCGILAYLLKTRKK